MILAYSSSCEKTPVDNGVQGTLVDIAGNHYLTYTIGTQTWMLDDLMTDKYNNGEMISKHAHGKYDFFQVETGKLCPVGWHVPESWEWFVLTDYFTTNNETPMIGNLGYWWSSSTLVDGYESPQAYVWYQNESAQMPREMVALKEDYYAVRCIKNK